MLDGVADQFHPVVQLQLAERVLHVVLHRAVREHQPLGDLLVGEPGADHAQDLGLTVSEPRCIGRGAGGEAAELAEHQPGQSRGEDRIARASPWQAIAGCDSVVVDPHKHGLQPYGCGAVLFRDPDVGRFYLHDSPYTYFTSTDLHLGEISLECSRAGASAAALWLTFRLLPPTAGGLGQVLAAGRRAALDWSELIEASDVLRLYQRPELDIVTYFPAAGPAPTMSGIDRASERVLRAGMTAPDPVYLSTLRAGAEAFRARHRWVGADADGARVLRSVLMKPEHEQYVPHLHARVEELARPA